MKAKIFAAFFIIALVLLSGCIDAPDDDNDDDPSNCLPDWGCKDNGTKAYRNADCSWGQETACGNGCLDGECITKEDSCEPGWHCKDENTKAYQEANCSSRDDFFCTNGCIDGECIQDEECETGWECKDANTKAYKMLDCSWNLETACEEGCSNGACDDAPADSCAGVECDDICLGNTRRYGGSCVDGSCTHSGTEVCEFGCENAACTGEGNLFVTSGEWLSGSGTSSADALCANSAAGAGLGGAWVSLMSDSANSAGAMAGFPAGALKKLDGTVVATGKADLFDGTIESPIDLTEIGTRLSGQDYVWTGTDTDGGSAVANCVDWISSNPTKGGMAGNAAQTNWRWLAWGSNVCNDDTLHLYCVKLD